MAERCPSCTNPVPVGAETCWSCGAALEASAAGGRKGRGKRKGGERKRTSGAAGGRLGLLVKFVLLVVMVMVICSVAVSWYVYRTLDPCSILSRELERGGVAAAGFLVGPDANPSGVQCLKDFATVLPGAVLGEEGEGPRASPWSVAAGTTPDGSRLAVLSLPSVPGEGDGGLLSIRCEGGSLSASIDWRAQLGDAGNVAWRVGSGSFSERWPTNEAGTSTLFPGDARQLVRDLGNAPELVAAVSPGDGRTRSATFRPVGLSLELLALREACGG